MCSRNVQLQPSHHKLDKTPAETPWEGVCPMFSSWPRRVKLSHTGLFFHQRSSDVSWLQPTRDKHPSPPKINIHLPSVQETWEKEVLKVVCSDFSSVAASKFISWVSLILLVLSSSAVCDQFQLSVVVTAAENTPVPVILLQNKSF